MTIVTNGGPGRDYLQAEYVMNLYRGCSFGCIYCYARSTYYEKTADFSAIRPKENALEIVRNDLRRKVKRGVVLTGGVSDAYNPLEKELKITRNALELLNAFEFGITIITKSNLVIRDMDILTDIQQNAPVSVNFSITCADNALAQKVEPHVPSTSVRFAAIKALSNAGIPAGLLIDPVLPFITDTPENIRELVKMAALHGAKYAYISPSVTLADIQRDYFYTEVDKHFQYISEKYKKRYDQRYRCQSPYAKKACEIFGQTCEAEGLLYDMKAVNQHLRMGYKM
ncbi:MAG: radical SAM protein [Defluviitaleaceae bacterium]|nr:radical SAM protein [Defluviitaleaceae bacterium]MCL2273968.1 radical SAM protein [Defluviitaleaceae bacterium]